MQSRFLSALFAFVAVTIFTMLAPHALAACSPIYGGGPTCTDTSLTIASSVANPVSSQFVPNLGETSAKFHGNDAISFKVTVTNTGTKNLSSIRIKDTLPNVVIFLAGNGAFDSTSNTLTIPVTNLAPKESKSFTINGRIVAQSQFPLESTFCSQNTVSALPSSGSEVQANSQFCMTKIGESPSTGPNDLILSLLLPLGLLGFAMKRRAIHII